MHCSVLLCMFGVCGHAMMYIGVLLCMLVRCDVCWCVLMHANVRRYIMTYGDVW